MADALGYLNRILALLASRAGKSVACRVHVGMLACCVLLSTAHAQPVNSSGQFVRFTVFAAKPVTDVTFAPRAGAAPVKLVFYPTARSPRYDYRGAMPLRFVDATTGTIVAEAMIPPGVREALLLFSPLERPAGGKSTLRYQIAVLDDSAARQGPGQLAIINFSGLTLAGTVNKENVSLRAGLNPPVRVGRAAAIALRTTFNQRSYQSYAGTLNLTGKQRALLILFPPYYPGSLEAQSRMLIDEATAAPAAR